MMHHLMIYLQTMPEFDLEKFGAFSLALMLLIWFVSFLIKDRNFYRDQVKERTEEIRKLNQQRQEETKATVEALKETKRMLEEQINHNKKFDEP